MAADNCTPMAANKATRVFVVVDTLQKWARTHSTLFCGHRRVIGGHRRFQSPFIGNAPRSRTAGSSDEATASASVFMVTSG
jgi:hypothetical protein